MKEKIGISSSGFVCIKADHIAFIILMENPRLCGMPEIVLLQHLGGHHPHNFKQRSGTNCKKFSMIKIKLALVVVQYCSS